MSGITLAQAQQVLDALIAAQIADPAGTIGSFSIAGRSVSYRDSRDMIDQINYWSSIVAQKQRQAAGQSRHGFAVADFRGRS